MKKYAQVEGLLAIVRDGLCHRCGACVGFCPSGTLGLDAHAYPTQIAECTRCNICVEICSGARVDYPTLGRMLFGEAYRWGDRLGVVHSAFVAHANDPEIRRGGASGGVVTQLLAHWLEEGVVRGALVTVEDPNEPALGRGIIARTRAELLASQQSRYATAPSFAALKEIAREEGPFAVVGLPCQVHALRQRQLMDSRWKQRVPRVIGLLCHYNLPFESSRALAARLAPPGARLARVRFRQRDERGWPHNTTQFWFTDGSHWRCPLGPAQIFNLAAYTAPLGRCLLCFDAAAELADLAVGDPWIRGPDGRWKYCDPAGWSAVLCRTPAAESWLRDAERAGRLTLRPIDPAEVEAGQFEMMTEKKERTALRLRVYRRLGRPIPEYPMPWPRTSPSQLLREIRFWLTRLLACSPRLGQIVVRVGLGPLGVWYGRRKEKRRAKKMAAYLIR